MTSPKGAVSDRVRNILFDRGVDEPELQAEVKERWFIWMENNGFHQVPSPIMQDLMEMGFLGLARKGQNPAFFREFPTLDWILIDSENPIFGLS